MYILFVYLFIWGNFQASYVIDRFILPKGKVMIENVLNANNYGFNWATELNIENLIGNFFHWEFSRRFFPVHFMYLRGQGGVHFMYLIIV